MKISHILYVVRYAEDMGEHLLHLEFGPRWPEGPFLIPRVRLEPVCMVHVVSRLARKWCSCLPQRSLEGLKQHVDSGRSGTTKGDAEASQQQLRSVMCMYFGTVSTRAELNCM